MKISLIREELKRYPTTAHIELSPRSRITNVGLYLSDYCDSTKQGHHYRCQMTACECVCHDNSDHHYGFYE
jgi:hypothetical protein